MTVTPEHWVLCGGASHPDAPADALQLAASGPEKNLKVDIAGINSPDLRVELLSGGQQQAVAIARAVHFKNKMLLLDEPTSALSVRETEKVLQYIAQLRSEGVSCVFVTHNLYHAFQVCDRFVVMAQGRVVLDVAKRETGIDELTRVVVSH